MPLRKIGRFNVWRRTLPITEVRHTITKTITRSVWQMAKQPRFLLFVMLLMLSAVLIAPLAKAQEDNESPYLPITLDNLTQLQVLFTFPCAKENYGVSGASFTGNNFVYECYTGQAAFTVRSLPANHH